MTDVVLDGDWCGNGNSGGNGGENCHFFNDGVNNDTGDMLKTSALLIVSVSIMNDS